MVEWSSLEDHLQGATKTLDTVVESTNSNTRETNTAPRAREPCFSCRYGDKIHNPSQTCHRKRLLPQEIETLEPTHSSVIRERGQQAGTPSIVSGQSPTGRLAGSRRDSGLVCL